MKSGDVAVIGLGRSGLSTVKFLLKHGITPDVFDTRDNPAGKVELPNQVKLVCGARDGEVLSH